MKGKKVYRGTQVIFGERKHLEEVLRSVQRAKLPRERARSEIRALRELIRTRTEELDGINSSWERKFALARKRSASSRDLLRLASRLPLADYLLARALAEHPKAPGELLGMLAGHPYSAVRESVARHPNTPPRVLERMAQDNRDPLWVLVAANPSTPEALRSRLRRRLRGPA